ncbi:MAG: hypothetical protein IKX34_09075 [Bacteroidales bacterium]|nr:hypothetical protein [Bacteroidales bacterium]
MKRSLILILMAACLCLCNCSQFNHEKEGDLSTKSSWELLHPGEILLSPYTPVMGYDNEGKEIDLGFQNSVILNFDKNGGQTKVIAYYPSDELVTLNEEYKKGAYRGEIPSDKVSLIESQVSVIRTKLDDFRSEYALTVHTNRVGVDYEYLIDLIDFSHKRKDGSPYPSKAVITVHQTAE